MTNQKNKSSTKEIVAHYAKSNYCRVIYADGAWGGLTPSMNIQMALFSEHMPIPRSIKYHIEPLGKLSEISQDREDGITREVEVEVILNLEVARALRDWLDERLKQAADLLQKAEAERKQEAGHDA